MSIPNQTNPAFVSARYTGPTAASKTDAKANKNLFLKLMVAQMKNQDPTKPTDPTAMTQQIAQFNMVDQQTTTNNLLTQLTNASKATDFSRALSAIGKSVVYNGNSIEFDGSNPTSFKVNLPSDASSLKISLQAPDGSITPIFRGSARQGPLQIKWDGSLPDGTKAAAGAYKLLYQSSDLSGQAMKGVTTEVSAKVTAVRPSDKGFSMVTSSGVIDPASIKEYRL